MRVVSLFTLLLMAACSAPGGTAVSSPKQTGTSTPAAAQSCRLPVWWLELAPGGQETETHTGFISLPDGAFRDAGTVPPPANMPAGLASFQFADAAWIQSQQKWVRAPQNLISPDGASYAYWTGDPTGAQIHVASTSTGDDRVIYSGAMLLVPIAFKPEGIYAVRVINLRQSAFENLYLLDPGGGAPRLVPGSDRHMYQYGWILVSDGAAWGMDYRVDGTKYFYSVLRLDLGSHQVTKWFEGPADEQYWPLGVDANHRLYAMFQSTRLVRLDRPGHAVDLENPPKFQPGIVGGAASLSLDPYGVSLAAVGGVWHYGEDPRPRRYLIGRPDAIVWPAGPCLQPS
jgi:hypothetical protein